MTHSEGGIARRSGTTALIPFLFVTLIGLLVYLGAVSFLTSTSARTTYRVADLRMVSEACMSALQATTQQFRKDLGFRNANFKPPYAESGPFPSKDYPVDPALRQQYLTQMGVELAPTVRFAVVEWHNSPTYDRNRVKRSDPYPQGIIEMMVTARSTGANFRVARRFIQRRVFWLSFSDKADLLRVTLATAAPEDGELFIGSAPLATMIQNAEGS